MKSGLAPLGAFHLSPGALRRVATEYLKAGRAPVNLVRNGGSRLTPQKSRTGGTSAAFLGRGNPGNAISGKRGGGEGGRECPGYRALRLTVPVQRQCR